MPGPGVDKVSTCQVDYSKVAYRGCVLPIRRFAYTSKSTHPFSERELLDLLHDARDYNAADGITGLLLYREGCFLQILEGKPDLVEDVSQRIARDLRHHEVEVLLDQEVDTRLFPQWSMEAVELERLQKAGLPGLSMDLADSRNAAQLVAHLPQIAAWLGEHQ